MPDVAPAALEERNIQQRLLDFIEQPLFILAAGVVLGLVALTVYRPVLVVCGVLLILAFYRAKVVDGRSVWVQMAVYLLVVGVAACGLVLVNETSHKAQDKTAEGVPEGVDFTKRPYFVGQAGGGYFLKPSLQAPTTDVFLMVGLTNRGVPSALGGWRLHCKSPTLDQDFGYIEIPETFVATARNPKGLLSTLTFRKADSLYEKTLEPVSTGKLVRGWTRFRLPGGLYPELGTQNMVLTVSFFDAFQNRYTIPYISADNPNSKPKYYPGIEGPIQKD